MSAIVDPGFSGTLDGEIWRGVVGFEQRYLVSNLGRVLSIYSQFGPRKRPLLMKNGTYSKYGHKQIQTWRESVSSAIPLHRAVLEAFAGPPPSPDYDCAHLDSDPTNNRLSNLAWKTRKENQHDRFAAGTDPQGERNPAAKLTAEQVAEMRALHAQGMSRKAVAARFGMSYPHTRRILLGLNWQEGGTPLARRLAA